MTVIFFTFLKVFMGNKGSNTVVEHWSFFARYIRFHPEAWNEVVGMRVEAQWCRNGTFMQSFLLAFAFSDVFRCLKLINNS